MKMDFWKYQGTGNDFIMLDGRTTKLEISADQIESLCHRRFGIGADGFIILQPSESADFKMQYFNSDGRTSSMCGNGGRCILHFANKLGLVKDHYWFEAIDGMHEGRVEANKVHLKMNDVPAVHQLSDNEFFLDTGSPHHIVFVDTLPGETFLNKAMAIRYSEKYRSEGVNVSYVTVESDQLKIRTYERGVEDETYSCGTGVTAAAVAAHFAKKIKPSGIAVQAVGGELEVQFNSGAGLYDNIWLIAPAQAVFQGSIEV